MGGRARVIYDVRTSRTPPSLISARNQSPSVPAGEFCFLCELACFMANDEQDIRRSLARAFDRAWDGYYRSERLTVSQDVARTELARRLSSCRSEVGGEHQTRHY